MKVVCIKGEWSSNINFIPALRPKEGDILTVNDCKMSNGLRYSFKEIPLHQGGIDNWWDASAFVPFDSYKEKEISELKEELQLL